MFHKTISRGMVVMALVAMMNLTIGCNHHTAPTAQTGSSQNFQSATFEGSGTSLWLDDFTKFGAGGVSVTLYDATQSGENEFEFTYSYVDDNNQERFRTLKMSGTDAPCSAVMCRVFDESGVFLIGYRVGLVVEGDTTMVLDEWTPTDSLTLEKKVINERSYEHYIINGAEFSLNFTEDEAYAYLLSNEKSERDTNPAAKRAEPHPTQPPAFAEFEAFYGAGTTLDCNLDGYVMTGMLLDEQFLEWTSTQLGIEMYNSSPDKLSVEQVCKIAGYLTGKCVFGGAGNFVCVAAVGITAACAIVDIYNWITSLF